MADMQKVVPFSRNHSVAIVPISHAYTPCKLARSNLKPRFRFCVSLVLFSSLPPPPPSTPIKRNKTPPLRSFALCSFRTKIHIRKSRLRKMQTPGIRRARTRRHGERRIRRRRLRHAPQNVAIDVDFDVLGRGSGVHDVEEACAERDGCEPQCCEEEDEG